ncbi:hypothetical protein [Aquimarina aggregata]|uniref:hypothetical protein n=1 Tax=Aquimarina aggregata TaxID=1642818 RepID=UPI000AB2279A|nr:hypothetical protein [Aquimarina aggregata]
MKKLRLKKIKVSRLSNNQLLKVQGGSEERCGGDDGTQSRDGGPMCANGTGIEIIAFF